MHPRGAGVPRKLYFLGEFVHLALKDGPARAKSLSFQNRSFPSISPPKAHVQTVLTIAGFDPSSGAGVTADLMVFAAHRLFGASAITALTVQSTVGVRSVHPVAPEILRSTLDCLHADLPPSGIKIGMLAAAANVLVVCEYLEKVRAGSSRHSVPVVLDPVLLSSSGRELLDQEGIGLLCERLLPLVDWVTPNLAELAALSGQRVDARDGMPGASRRLQRQVSGALAIHRLGVFATGGHLDPPDDLLLAPDGTELWLSGKRIDSRATHGTGCALSSAFLTRLALGDSPVEAAREAKEYVAGAIRASSPQGSGSGPMQHLWNIERM
jgi:hydroxymethylpyrimidine/phosphomethylpyrimidine kinase